MSNDIGYPVINHIQHKMTKLVDSYLEKHSKGLVTRLDIRYPKDHDEVNGNQDISQTMELAMQELRRRGYDPKYAWVREQNESVHPHYHAMVILNGNKVQSPYKAQKCIEKHWGNTIGADPKGLVDHCYGSKDDPHENGKIITRKEGVPDYVKRQINYMAKPQGKGMPKDGMRDFGMSRIKNTQKNPSTGKGEIDNE